MKPRSYLATARQGWHGAPPDYVAALAEALDAGRSFRALEAQVGYSRTVLLRVVDGTYGHPRGNLERVAEALRGALLGKRVRCPAAGTITRADCLGHQRRPHDPGNSLHVAIYRACRNGCPHSDLEPYAHVRARKGRGT